MTNQNPEDEDAIGDSEDEYVHYNSDASLEGSSDAGHAEASQF